MELGKGIRFNRSVVIIFFILVIIFTFYLLLGSSNNNSNYVEKTIKISELLSASIFLAEEAGKAVVEIRKGGSGGGKDSSIDAKLKQVASGKEYVTKGDHKSHYVITQGLKSIWPMLRYKSEESDNKSDKVNNNNNIPRPPLHNSEVSHSLKRDEAVDINDVIVWIDPLDATQEYTEGGTKPDLLKYVTVMICIVIKEEPIASVIHQPFVKGESGHEGMTYWGWINHGVSPNIYKSSDISGSENIRIISSRSHSGGVKKIANKAFQGQKIEHITAAGSGYKTLQIARNKADLYLHTTRIKKWDTCAGDAIISAMGGVMKTRKDQFITYSISDSPEIPDGLVVTRTEVKNKIYMEKLKVH